MPTQRRVEQVMGTAVSVQVADPLPTPDVARLIENTFAWLHEVDRRFSTYRTDSEVSRWDRGELRYPDCSADLHVVVEACADLWQATGGWFDVHATGRFDPSGYVKGWAVQVASDRLLAAGAANHCVNAGGDVRVRGGADGAEDGSGWRVGIRHPVHADRVCWVLSGRDLAVATSGTYERGQHVVDPFRGRPAGGLCSVTVVGDDLGLADGYATAAVAMGRAGLRWLDGLSGYHWAAVTDAGEAYRSPGFPVADPAARQPAASQAALRAPRAR